MSATPMPDRDRDQKRQTTDPLTTSQHPFQLPASMLAAALYWHSFGFAVIPIVPASKRPAVSWDPWLEKLSPSQIKRHWREHPDHEVGCIVGNKHIVFDADSPDAVAYLRDIEHRLGAVPSMVVRTKRGEHHYFRTESELHAKTTFKCVGGEQDRIDVKTGRTMIILPPSTGKALARLDRVHASCFDAVLPEMLREFGAVKLPVCASAAGVPLVEASEKDIAIVRAGLARLDPDCKYPDWLQLAAVAFHVSGGSETGLEVFDEWSSAGKKYKGRRETQAKWYSFRPDHPKPCTMATLRYKLAELGHDWSEVCEEAEGGFVAIAGEGK